MTRRVISWRRSNSAAFGAKQRLVCTEPVALDPEGPHNEEVAATAQVKRDEGERTTGMLFMERVQGRLLRLNIRLANNLAIGLMLATNECGKLSPADANWVETLTQ
jgi:hypothetical protein